MEPFSNPGSSTSWKTADGRWPYPALRTPSLTATCGHSRRGCTSSTWRKSRQAGSSPSIPSFVRSKTSSALMMSTYTGGASSSCNRWLRCRCRSTGRKSTRDVLAVWGKAEYVSTEADHHMIADLINRKHPGRGTFRALDGIDHGLHRAASAQDRFKEVNAGVNSEFNPVIIEALRGWIDKLAKTS